MSRKDLRHLVVSYDRLLGNSTVRVTDFSPYNVGSIPAPAIKSTAKKQKKVTCDVSLVPLTRPLKYFVNGDKVDHITREARIVKVRSFVAE